MMSAPSRHALIGALALCLSIAAGSSIATAQTYKVDDGTPGTSLTYAYPEDLCWVNWIHNTGTTTLTSIEAIFGDAPDGTAVHLAIWRDLGQVGQPWEGLLLNETSTTVRNSGKQLLTQYSIPPTQVTGSFFVGAYMTLDGSMSPMTMDPHTANAHLSWFCTGYGPGSFDPTYLGIYSWYSPMTLGIKGVFMLRANGLNGPDPEARCVGKVNSLGCVPSLDFSGSPSVSAGAGFLVSTHFLRNQSSGLFLYSKTGLQQVPFSGGNLCVVPPVRRTGALNTGGNPTGEDCSGSLSFDFNAWIATGADPALVPGTTVDGQFWSRDTGFLPPNNVGLSQAAHFGLAP